MDDIVWLRDIDGTGSMHVCAQGDSGAVVYHREGSLIEKLQDHYDEMCGFWGEDSGEAGSAFVALEIAKKGEYR